MDKIKGEIGTSDNNSEMLGRMFMNSLKLAGLVACGMPFIDGHPVITKEVARWAIEFINSSTRNLMGVFDRGQAGIDQNSSHEGNQLRVIKRIIHEFLIKKDEPGFWKLKSANWLCSEAAKLDIIGHNFLSQKATGGPFQSLHGLGKRRAIETALENLVDAGALHEYKKYEMAEMKFRAIRAYRVTDKKAFIE